MNGFLEDTREGLEKPQLNKQLVYYQTLRTD